MQGVRHSRSAIGKCFHQRVKPWPNRALDDARISACAFAKDQPVCCRRDTEECSHAAILVRSGCVNSIVYKTSRVRLGVSRLKMVRHKIVTAPFELARASIRYFNSSINCKKWASKSAMLSPNISVKSLSRWAFE